MSLLLAQLVQLAVVGVLLWVIRVDFATLTISNRAVLILLGLYVLWAALGGFATFWTDLFSGALLFLMALVMWLLRMMGAGDVKLYAAIGMLVGLDHLLGYALLLLAISAAFVVVIQIGGRRPATGAQGRLHHFRTSGKAPYAVPIGLAAIPMIMLRAFA